MDHFKPSHGGESQQEYSVGTVEEMQKYCGDIQT